MPISIAPLLKQQSPSRHFENGFIELPSGKRWRPRHDQVALLRGLSTAKPTQLLRRLLCR
ncbi:phage filamentation protein Fil family protein [Serratia proteamaculans]|uniref:phage filamentation protein Fil family protein n=1 Tax=Serratia proteamaculans TaxID=28151 RepID=UPI002980E6E5|nr:phage filamentation protein Fil family protein [Serratia proteamaculans]MDW5510212.1 phage filamentation protein Fil family protein [Serratia proteamaculans]